MATLLRPPLVFAPQARRNIGAPEVYPNLLVTTLRPVLAPPLASIRLTDSAPQRKKPVQFDAYPNLSLTSLVTPPDTTNLPLVQLYGSAPQARRRQYVDDYPNLSVTTLAPAVAFPMPLAAIRIDGAGPTRKPVVQVDLYTNLLTSTLASPVVTVPLPVSAVRWDWPAPPLKRPVQVDQPMQRPIWLDPVPQMQQWNESAPRVKFRNQVDLYPNTLALGINPNAAPLRLDQSAPPPKRPVYVDVLPNLSATTLLPPPVPVPLPLSAVKLDQSAPPRKRPVQVDAYQNLLQTCLAGSLSQILEVVPYLIEDPLAAALMRIAGIRCTASVIGTTGSVTLQSPDAFTIVPRGTVITITLGGTPNNGPGRGRAQAPYGTPDGIPAFSLTRKH